jgi:hypothetical protein
MTQPAWPSNTWQILNSDYDTQSSFYGVKKACEPLHIQLDLSNYSVAVVNTTNDSQPALVLSASVYSLDNKLLLHKEEKRDAGADAVSDGFQLELAPLLQSEKIALVSLELKYASGEIVSRNFYWLGADNASYRRLNRLPAASLSATAKATRTGENIRVLPGESREIELEYPAKSAMGAAQVALRGWNLATQVVRIP